MILRMWKGRASAEKAGEYVQHTTDAVFPRLQTIPGYRGGYLLQRPMGAGVELLVLTLWASMEAVQQFAGQRADQAIVEPQARSALSQFDDLVTHFQVVTTHGQPR